MADKLRTQQQLEALQARHVGTGHADTQSHEWNRNVARDTYASIVGHPALLEYTSLGLGQSRELTRIQMLERFIQPNGPPPPKDERAKKDHARLHDTRVKPEQGDASSGIVGRKEGEK